MLTDTQIDAWHWFRLALPTVRTTNHAEWATVFADWLVDQDWDQADEYVQTVRVPDDWRRCGSCKVRSYDIWWQSTLYGELGLEWVSCRECEVRRPVCLYTRNPTDPTSSDSRASMAWRAE